MIARMWHGVVPKDRADAYCKYMDETGFTDYKNSEGCLDLKILRNDENSVTHFLLITLWDNFESIKKFAGDNYQKARYYPEDKDYLLEMEEKVAHYEVIESI